MDAAVSAGAHKCGARQSKNDRNGIDSIGRWAGTDAADGPHFTGWACPPAVLGAHTLLTSGDSGWITFWHEGDRGWNLPMGMRRGLAVDATKRLVAVAGDRKVVVFQVLSESNFSRVASLECRNARTVRFRARPLSLDTTGAAGEGAGPTELEGDAALSRMPSPAAYDERIKTDSYDGDRREARAVKQARNARLRAQRTLVSGAFPALPSGAAVDWTLAAAAPAGTRAWTLPAVHKGTRPLTEAHVPPVMVCQRSATALSSHRETLLCAHADGTWHEWAVAGPEAASADGDGGQHAAAAGAACPVCSGERCAQTCMRHPAAGTRGGDSAAMIVDIDCHPEAAAVITATIGSVCVWTRTASVREEGRPIWAARRVIDLCDVPSSSEAGAIVAAGLVGTRQVTDARDGANLTEVTLFVLHGGRDRTLRVWRTRVASDDDAAASLGAARNAAARLDGPIELLAAHALATDPTGARLAPDEDDTEDVSSGMMSMMPGRVIAVSDRLGGLTRITLGTVPII